MRPKVSNWNSTNQNAERKLAFDINTLITNFHNENVSVSGLAVRGSSLQARIDKLAVKVSKLSDKRSNHLYVPTDQTTKLPTDQTTKLSISTYIAKPLLFIFWPVSRWPNWTRMLRRSPSRRFNWEKLSAPLRTLTSRCVYLTLEFLIQIAINKWPIEKLMPKADLLIMFLHQVVSRESMPKSMLEQYLACDKPPPLDKLNPYRWNILSLFIRPNVARNVFLMHVFWLSTSQGGRQRWTEILHGCKLFLRPVALGNAAVHREG